jgi:hypothetical protein
MTDYAKPWQEYRKRRNLILFAFLGYVPALGLIAALTIWAFKSTTPAFVAAFGWMVLYAVAGRHQISTVQVPEIAGNCFSRNGGITTRLRGDVSTEGFQSMPIRLRSNSFEHEPLGISLNNATRPLSSSSLLAQVQSTVHRRQRTDSPQPADVRVRARHAPTAPP